MVRQVALLPLQALPIERPLLGRCAVRTGRGCFGRASLPQSRTPWSQHAGALLLSVRLARLLIQEAFRGTRTTE